MQLLLDTTFLIDVERGELSDAIDDDDDVAIAAITIAELRVGALLADTQRRRSARAAYVDDLAANIPILAYDLQVAESHAELLVAVREQGRPRRAHDLIIAATARCTGRVVVTADARAFTNLPDVVVRSH